MTESNPPARCCLLVRSGGLTEEEHAVLGALKLRLAREGAEIVEVLLGTAGSEVETPGDTPSPATAYWVLEDDVRGRGIRPHPSRNIRIATAEELATRILSSSRVINLP